jgi:hypothetical protein
MIAATAGPRLLSKTGELVAVSVNFPTKRAAAAGISLVREIAGTGLIRDMSTSTRDELSHRIRPSQISPIHNSAQRLRMQAGLTTHRGPVQPHPARSSH